MQRERVYYQRCVPGSRSIRHCKKHGRQQQQQQAGWRAAWRRAVSLAKAAGGASSSTPSRVQMSLCSPRQNAGWSSPTCTAGKGPSAHPARRPRRLMRKRAVPANHPRCELQPSAWLEKHWRPSQQAEKRDSKDRFEGPVAAALTASSLACWQDAAAWRFAPVSNERLRGAACGECATTARSSTSRSSLCQKTNSCAKADSPPFPGVGRRKLSEDKGAGMGIHHRQQQRCIACGAGLVGPCSGGRPPPPGRGADNRGVLRCINI